MRTCMEKIAKLGKSRSETVEHGTTNVFADLGFADAQERQQKVRLAVSVNDILDTHALNQSQMAALLGISQPQISNLRGYKLERFSAERLMRFLTLLNRDIDIVIRRKKSPGKIGEVAIREAA